MAKTMELPKIGVNMTEAVVAEWYVKPGDEVSEGTAIMLAETDKATQDIYSTDSGIVGKLLVEPGEKVKIHDPIMILLEKGETLSEGESVQEKEQEEQSETESKTLVSKEDYSKQEKFSTGNRVVISPLARKMAKDMGLNINDLKPEKPGRRIVKKDVLAAAKRIEKSKESAPDTYVKREQVMQVIPMSNTRKIIASKMSQSNLEKPCAALTLTACTDEIIKIRNKYKERGAAISYNDIIVKIVAQALTEHRSMNSVLNGDEIHLLEDINIGVAVDSDRGLMVPVIKNADRKRIVEIAQEFSRMVTSIRENRINPDDLSGGTFTITNLGMYEIEQFTPIINPPECCILAIGAIKKEFVPDDEMNPVLATVMQMTLVFDHRILDGAPAARFLQKVKHYIECPELLL
jgi:pyruvate dehydrogenase E2 component (dihydrolipoamide acetyltransferase)